MSKPPSDATKLKAARRNEKALEKRVFDLQREVISYRARASKGEQEAAEWKKRFDALLEATGQLRYSGSPLPVLPTLPVVAPGDCGCPANHICMSVSCPRQTRITCEVGTTGGLRG